MFVDAKTKRASTLTNVTFFTVVGICPVYDVDFFLLLPFSLSVYIEPSRVV